MTTQNATTKTATPNTQAQMSEADLRATLRESTSAEDMRAARRELERREDEARALANKNKLEREAAEKIAEEKRQAQASFELEEAIRQHDLVRAEVLPALMAAAKIEQALKGARERVQRAAGAARSSAVCTPNPWALETVKKMLAFAFEKVGGGLSDQQRAEIDRLLGSTAVSLVPVAAVAPPPKTLSHAEVFALVGLEWVECNGVLKERVARSLASTAALQGKTFDEREKLNKEALAKIEAKAAELGAVVASCEAPA